MRDLVETVAKGEFLGPMSRFRWLNIARRYGFTVSNPHLSEAAHWEAALEHYQWDRLHEAFELVRGNGVGESGILLKHYRLIEAEYITRQKGVVRTVNDWLSIEFLPSELMGLESDLAARILAGCEEIAQRLDWKHTQLTRVAILAEETDADWATYPFGYCITKEPYEKICLPNYLLDDPDEFHRAVAHEYAHVISSLLSDANAPRWLEEAISVLAEGAIDDEISREFMNGTFRWLKPDELESVLESRGDETAELDPVLRAYQQSGWIGRYLHSVGSDIQIRNLLTECGNEQILTNLKLQLLGRDRVDGAMKSVYDLSLKQVFDNAFQYLCMSTTLVDQ